MSRTVSEEIKLQWDVGIVLRDGVRLSAMLYLPEPLAKPSPVVFAMTPYTAQRNHARASYFATHGYPFLVVDVRGRGNSGGVFRPYIQEADDGYDIVEWIAAQPFCNGQVAMFSGSYEGYAQWATARGRPPHLFTIVPAMAPALGVDFPMRSNLFWPYIVQWLMFTAGHTLQERLFEDQAFWRHQFRQWYRSGRSFKDLGTIAGELSGTFQEWISHPTQDAYWDAFQPTDEELAGLEMPILTLTGCYDGDQPGALYHYRRHVSLASPAAAAKHFLVIGPWDHAGTLAPKSEVGGLAIGPGGVMDMLKLHVEWYDWTMRGGRRPEFLKDRVCYYVMGAERWQYAPTLKAVTERTEVLYLDSLGSATQVFASGWLDRGVGKGPPDAYINDPLDTHIVEREVTGHMPTSLWPQFPVDVLTEQDAVFVLEGRQLIYHGPPFDADTVISGFFRLEAWLSIDQPDCDFRAMIYELDARGGSVALTTDFLRARHRESLRRTVLIDTREPLLYVFDRFTFISRLIRKGHRLRLTIGSVHSLACQRNFCGGGIVCEETVEDARPVTVKLFHDSEHRSALHVPVGKAPEHMIHP